MRRMMMYGVIIIAAFMLLTAGLTSKAAGAGESEGNTPRGGALFDRWYAVTGQQPPDGNQPIWARQSNNTRSGPDTWRCVTCHGWDYQGKDGAYRSGSNYTGFPGVLQAAGSKSAAEIVAILKGSADKQHDFSPYLDDASLNDLAQFITTSLVDDNQYIDPITLQVKAGDPAHGKKLYTDQCARCHGADGTTIKFRFEGLDATLGTLALQDPWRFLHKTRFGTPGTPMVIGFDLKWSAQDGRDVLLYAQSLPSGMEKTANPPSITGREATPGAPPGGPAHGPLTGVLTALGAFLAGLGWNILVFGVLVGILLLVVWIIRGRNR